MAAPIKVGAHVTNAGEFALGIDAALRRAELAVLDAYKGMASLAYRYVVKETPQWTGQTAANWRFSFYAPDFSSSKAIKALRQGQRGKNRALHTVWQKGGSYYDAGRGNPLAWEGALQSLRGRVNNLGLMGGAEARALPPIFITNASDWEPGSYPLSALEHPPGGLNGGLWLRTVNHPGAMMARAVSYVSRNFGRIGPEELFALQQEAKS